MLLTNLEDVSPSDNNNKFKYIIHSSTCPFTQEQVPRMNHVMTERFLTYCCVLKQHYSNDLWDFWPLDPNIER